MKQTLLTIMFVLGTAIILNSCSNSITEPIETDYDPTVVQEVQMSLVNKMTATWCTSCGSWGWDLFENVISSASGKAIFMATHGNRISKLHNQTAEDFYDAFSPRAGFPAFAVNGINVTEYGMGSVYSDVTRENILNEINTSYNSKPIANSTYLTSITGNKLTIETKTKFFQSAQGEFYLGVYIIEDNVVEYQNWRGNDAKHHFVLRGSAAESTWGEMIISGQIQSGTEFEKTFEVDLDDLWMQDNIHLAVIIWEKTGETFKFINTFTHGRIQADQ